MEQIKRLPKSAIYDYNGIYGTVYHSKRKTYTIDRTGRIYSSNRE